MKERFSEWAAQQIQSFSPDTAEDVTMQRTKFLYRAQVLSHATHVFMDIEPPMMPSTPTGLSAYVGCRFQDACSSMRDIANLFPDYDWQMNFNGTITTMKGAKRG